MARCRECMVDDPRPGKHRFWCRAQFDQPDAATAARAAVAEYVQVYERILKAWGEGTPMIVSAPVQVQVGDASGKWRDGLTDLQVREAWAARAPERAGG